MQLVKTKKVILGVDPGSNITGYGVILSDGRSAELVTIGHIQMEKYDDHFDKLSRIFHRITSLIKEYNPQEIAVEAPFYHKNAQSMLKLGRAQGMAIAAALHHHIPIFEYSAKKVKKSVTGNGNASKEQVAAMAEQIVAGNKKLPVQLDATDGLAVALCHHFQGNSIVSEEKKYGSWSAFIKDNPKRVR
ncbi:MAG: crossover junction endodeoxyribonuclease RuvC [Bacteroidetes bacterium]|nr:crossover junction endodeoxyribonuclease RuvC [Bacteroidota bacterium]